MKKTHATAWIVSGALALVSAQNVFAHHSAAMFDGKKTFTVEGTVKQYQWTNPHGWLYVTFRGSDGVEADYSVELTSPNLLLRRSWRPTTFKVGDKVTVVTNPMHDGTPSGRVVSITKADGSVWTER